MLNVPNIFLPFHSSTMANMSSLGLALADSFRNFPSWLELLKEIA